MEGEEAIVHERLVSVTSAGAGENQIKTIQSYPSPEFLNSLSFIKKFYPLPHRGEGKVTEIAYAKLATHIIMKSQNCYQSSFRATALESSL